MTLAKKLRGRSFGELRERIEQRLAAELEYRNLAPTVHELTDRELESELHPVVTLSGISGPARLRNHFATRASPAFFAGVRGNETARAFRSDRWSKELADVVTAANRVVAGKFDLLGHEDLSFGSPIDWHFDPTTNRRAPRVHWSRIPYLDASLIGDHKVIWEINRHQHFFVLGRAFQGTGRDEYAECFVRHLTAWMDANPPKQGVNWASSLEVAYRVIAWLWALEFFREADALTPAVLQRLLKYLYAHGRHLERYLSTYFSPNTHLTGEALGLLYLGLLLPEFRRARVWQQLGWQILERELPRQVLPDGVYFEQASYYHRYTVDIYLHAVLLAQRNGITVPDAMLQRLDLAAGHLADLTRADGTVPGIGDDDGGRLVLLEQRPFADVRAALGIASVVLGRPEYAAVAGAATEEVLWILGPDGVQTVDSSLDSVPPAHLSRLFPVGGYAIMRDGWGPKANHAVIDCGPLGAMNCGHAHSDTLSIEVAVGGCPILVDTGTYTYTGSPTDRDRFRHSSSHNTVTVDGQSASVPNGPFAWATRAEGRWEQWWSGALVDRFVGSHHGFERLDTPALHRRSVLFVRGEYWVILDTVLSDGRHEATAHYHVTPGSRIEAVSERAAVIDTPCAGGHRRLFFAAAGDVGSVEWGEDWVSPSYGRRTLAPYARLTSRGNGRHDIVTVLVPWRDGSSPEVRELATNQRPALVVNRPDVSDLFLFRPEGGGPVCLDGVEMDADSALIRRHSCDGPVESVAVFGAAARLSIGEITFYAEGAAEAVRDASGWTVKGEGRVVVRA